MADSTDQNQPKKRRKSRRLSEADVGVFLRKYGRKAHPGHDPNDRSYSMDVLKKINRMKAEEFDLLIEGEDLESDPNSKGGGA